jgi:hypothetical protein
VKCREKQRFFSAKRNSTWFVQAQRSSSDSGMKWDAGNRGYIIEDGRRATPSSIDEKYWVIARDLSLSLHLSAFHLKFHYVILRHMAYPKYKRIYIAPILCMLCWMLKYKM